MAARFQLVMNCADAGLMTRFWADALGYVLEPPPAGFATWDDFRRDIGLPEEFLGGGADSIVDPDGRGPRIWFQVSPDGKTVPNRLHIDIHAGEGRTVPLAIRKQQVNAEAKRLAGLGATIVSELSEGDPDDEGGLDHYAVAMRDPEGNEFDINCAIG
jgi:hypothetical protein